MFLNLLLVHNLTTNIGRLLYWLQLRLLIVTWSRWIWATSNCSRNMLWLWAIWICALHACLLLLLICIVWLLLLIKIWLCYFLSLRMVNNWLLLNLVSMAIQLSYLTILFLVLLSKRMLVLNLCHYISISRNIIIKSYVLGWLNYINILVILRLSYLLSIDSFLSRIQILLLSSYHLLLIYWHIKISLRYTSWIGCYFLLSSNFARFYRINCLIWYLALVSRIRCGRVHSCTLRLWSLLLVHIYAKVLVIWLLHLIQIGYPIVSTLIIQHKRIP